MDLFNINKVNNFELFLPDGSKYDPNKILNIPKQEKYGLEEIKTLSNNGEIRLSTQDPKDRIYQEIIKYLKDIELPEFDKDYLNKIFEKILSSGQDYLFMPSEEQLNDEKTFFFSSGKPIPSLNRDQAFEKLESILIDSFKLSNNTNNRVIGKTIFYLDSLTKDEKSIEVINKYLDIFSKNTDKLSNLLLSELIAKNISKLDDQGINKFLDLLKTKEMLSSNAAKAVRFYKPELALDFVGKSLNNFPFSGDLSLKQVQENLSHYTRLANNDLLDENFYLGSNNDLPFLPRGSVGVEAEIQFANEDQGFSSYSDIGLGRDIGGIPELRTPRGGITISKDSLENLFNYFMALVNDPNFRSIESNHITLDGNVEESTIFKVKQEDKKGDKYAKDITEFNTPLISANLNGRKVNYLIDTQTLFDQIFLLDEMKYIMETDFKALDKKHRESLEISIYDYFNNDKVEIKQKSILNILLNLADIDDKQSLFFPILRLHGKDALPEPSDKQILALLLKLSDNVQGLNLADKNLANIKIKGKNLKDVDFSRANLVEALIENSNINGASFLGANLYGAKIKNTEIARSNFRGKDTYLVNAQIEDSSFPFSDFTGVERTTGLKLMRNNFIDTYGVQNLKT